MHSHTGFLGCPLNGLVSIQNGGKRPSGRVGLLPFAAFVTFLAGASIPDAWAREAVLADGPAPPFIRIRLCDTTGMDSTELDVLKQELARIYSSCFLKIVWLEECSNETSFTLPSIAWICILEEPPRFFRTASVTYHRKKPLAWLGWIPTSPEPRIYAFRKTIESRLWEGSIPTKPEMVARAMGRALAHELAHFFFGSQHTREGILKERLDIWDLTREQPIRLILTRRQADRVSAFLAQREERLTFFRSRSIGLDR